MSFRFDIPNLLLLISILASTYLFLVVFFNGANNPARRYLQGLILGVIGWAFGMFLYRGAATISSAYLCMMFFYFSAGITPIFLLLFALAFPDKPTLSKKWLLAIIGVGVIAAIFPILNKGFVAKIEILPGKETLVTFNRYLFFWGIYLIAYFTAAFIVLIKKFFISNGVAKLQLKYIIYGCLISAAIGVTTNHILYFILHNTDYAWAGPSGALIMVALITYAITNYKLMGIKFFIRRSLVVFAAIFTIVVLWYLGYRVILAFTEYNIAFNVFFVSLTPLLYIKLKNFYFDLSNRYLFSSLYDVHLLIKEINDKLWHLYSVQEIGGALRMIFKEIFHVDNLAIVEIDRSGRRMEAVLYNNGFDLNDNSLFEEGNIQNIFKKKTPEPILVEEFVSRHWLSAEMEAAVDWLQAVKPTVVAPLMSDGRVSGLLLVGAKASEDVFSREDIQVIRETAKSVSLAVGIARRDEERERELKEMREFVNNLENKKI